jgi:hypothetical protein
MAQNPVVEEGGLDEMEMVVIVYHDCKQIE